MNFVSLDLGLRKAFPSQCLPQVTKVFLKEKKKICKISFRPFSNCSTLNILLKTSFEGDTSRLLLHFALLSFPSQF